MQPVDRIVSGIHRAVFVLYAARAVLLFFDIQLPSISLSSENSIICGRTHSCYCFSLLHRGISFTIYHCVLSTASKKPLVPILDSHSRRIENLSNHFYICCGQGLVVRSTCHCINSHTSTESHMCILTCLGLPIPSSIKIHHLQMTDSRQPVRLRESWLRRNGTTTHPQTRTCRAARTASVRCSPFPHTGPSVGPVIQWVLRCL